MTPNSGVVLEGFTELREALKKLPAELVHEGAEIVQAHAAEAFRLIAAGLAFKTGNLRDHLRLEITSDQGGTRAVIRNTAKHAWWNEHGTKPRRYATKSKKSIGAMPAHPVLIPIAIRQRRVMTEALIHMVERAGFKVTGTGI